MSSRRLNSLTTLSLLTWKSPLTLGKTLRSLRPIEHLFADRLVVCQESDREEMHLAEKYGYRVIATRENSGIQGGIELAVRSANCANVLFAENDCHYIGGGKGIAILETAMAAFESQGLDVVKFQASGLSGKFRLYFGRNPSVPPRRTLMGMLRWQEANARLSEVLALYQGEEPDTEYLRRINDGLWCSDSKFTKWTNRPFLVRKEWFLGTLMKVANENPARRRINGKPDLECPINGMKGWWRRERFKIGLVKISLFGHERHDRPAEDDKWMNGGEVVPVPEDGK